MIDLSKLTPAPWVVCQETDEFGTIGMPVVRMDDDDTVVVGHPHDWGATNLKADSQFIALARNAFDVMMRRGWVASREYLWSDPERKDKAAWIVRHQRTEKSIASGGTAYALEIGPIVGKLGRELIWADDPFTALVEADKWYRENIEGK